MVTNSEADMIEITVPENREAVRDSKDWSKELVYKGVLFFDAYIEAMRSASPIAGIGKTVTVTQWDEDAGVDHEDSITIDGQEVYFGYIPSDDLFAMGFDLFADEGFSAVVFMKFDGAQFVMRMRDEHSNLFYDGKTHSTYNQLKRKFPDLLDIRLD
jgi:hypothetical protein